MTCDHSRKRTHKARAPFPGGLARSEEADRRGRLSADGQGWETKLVEKAIDERLREKRAEILRIAAKHGARNVRVFGSAARGEAKPGSDLDFLVELEPGRSLLDQAALVLDLEELLGCKVDVVTERGLYWPLRRRILKEARAL
jgi:predicted nucleotidyltransferase